MRTRSPTVNRTKCLRIFPDTCASTSCSLSSLTRNIVPGSTLEIVPSTSIGSSLIRFLSAAELPRLEDSLTLGIVRPQKLPFTLWKASILPNKDWFSVPKRMKLRYGF